MEPQSPTDTDSSKQRLRLGMELEVLAMYVNAGISYGMHGPTARPKLISLLSFEWREHSFHGRKYLRLMPKLSKGVGETKRPIKDPEPGETNLIAILADLEQVHLDFLVLPTKDINHTSDEFNDALRINNIIRDLTGRAPEGAGNLGVCACGERGFLTEVEGPNKIKLNLCANCKAKLEAQARISYVYVFGYSEIGVYKIGKSNMPKHRRSQVSIELPFEMDTQITIPVPFETAMQYEATLHAHFKAKRIKGEWFRLDDADLEFLKTTAAEQREQYAFA